MHQHQTLKLLARIKDTVHHNYRYQPHYSENEICDLIKTGLQLQLQTDLVHDLICCGHRRGKKLTVQRLKKQMAWYQNTVRERGFPFRFSTLAQFRAFSARVLQMLKGEGLPTQLVFIHGSSLRDPGARDVDLIVRLPDQAYERFSQSQSARSPLALNQTLDKIKQDFKLGGLDMLVVKDKTYFPNRPYLPVEA